MIVSCLSRLFVLFVCLVVCLFVFIFLFCFVFVLLCFFFWIFCFTFLFLLLLLKHTPLLRQIINNTFVNNTAATAILGVGLDLSQPNFTLFFNVLTNNSALSALYFFDSNRGGFRPSVNYNIFVNPNCTYEVRSLVYARSSPIDARWVVCLFWCIGCMLRVVGGVFLFPLPHSFFLFISVYLFSRHCHKFSSSLFFVFFFFLLLFFFLFLFFFFFFFFYTHFADSTSGAPPANLPSPT